MQKNDQRQAPSGSAPNLFGPGGVLVQLAAGLSDGIWMIDGNLRTVFANPAMADLLAAPVERIEGTSVENFVSRQDLQSISEELTARAGQGTIIRELTLTRADRERVWVRFNVLPWLEDSGSKGGLVAVVQNITERRAADETQALLAAIVTSSDDAIISKTLNGIITSWNHGATQVFGYEAHEAIGKSITMIIPENRLHEETEFLTKIRRGEKINHFETVRRRKDGRLIDISVSISPIRNADGIIIGASKVARDISQTRTAERTRGHLAAIVESSNDAIVSKSLEGNVQSWNHGAELLFGYTAEEMIGEHITKILPPDRYAEEEKILARIRRGEVVRPYETIRRAKDGSDVEVSITVSPIRDLSGKIVGASKVARDIGPQKEAERALKRSEEALRELAETLEERVKERTMELEAALREMEGFTYTISHDLRAPLRAIIASCRVLEDDYGKSLSPEATSILNRQVKAANKMATLIDDLLRLSRLGRQELRITQLDLSRLASEVAAEAAVNATGECPRFVISPGMTAYGDDLLLRLALQNLIENSIKFSKPGEVAQIEVGRYGECFFVRDSGIGFDPQYSERIFAPFERLHRDVDYPGTGIGLANVKRIIERHHGKVWAEGEPGRGATFYFTLPQPPQSEPTGPQ